MDGMDDPMTDRRPVIPESLRSALARVAGTPVGLLALGIPRCPASMLLPASLSELAVARPHLPIALGILAGPGDWADRETLLWPRGIRISRSVVPVLVVLREGRAVATRHGGASARLIDAWLDTHLGPADAPIPDQLSAAEIRELERIAARRAQHAAVTTHTSAEARTPPAGTGGR